MSRYNPRGKTSLAQLAPDLAAQFSELQSAIGNLGEKIGAALAVQKQEAEQQKAKQAPPPPEREPAIKDRIIDARLCNPIQGYRAKELAKILSIHEQTLWRWVREGRIPRGVKIGEMTTVWPTHVIAAWLEQKAKGRAAET